jgi:hypothetical protein
MGNEGTVGLVIGLCVIAILVGVAVGLSGPPMRPTSRDVFACAGSCATCARGDVVGCYHCGTCARFMPR